jgi:hypothetical protein
MRAAREAPGTAPRLQGGVLKYFLLLVALSVPFWIAGSATLPVRVNLPVSALQAVCPLLAALILVRRQDGTTGVRRFLRRAFDDGRVGDRRWYMPSLLLMPAVSALAYVVMRLTDRPLPQQPEIPWLTAPLLFVAFLLFGIGEELGWMGYAADRLQQRHSALTTALVLGAVGVAWHLVPLLQADHTPVWIAGWAVNTIAMRVLVVWIYSNAGGSVLTAILFHTSSNMAWSLFPNDGSHYDPVVIGAINALAVLAVTAAWGPRTLVRARRAAATPAGGG